MRPRQSRNICNWSGTHIDPVFTLHPNDHQPLCPVRLRQLRYRQDSTPRAESFVYRYHASETEPCTYLASLDHLHNSPAILRYPSATHTGRRGAVLPLGPGLHPSAVERILLCHCAHTVSRCGDGVHVGVVCPWYEPYDARDSWQVVAQVTSELAVPLLEGADGIKDSEVDKRINEDTAGPRSYVIARSRKTSRIELAAVES